jgi:hypothetical protein
LPAREVQDGVGLVAGAYHHALAGAVPDLAVDAYALGAAGRGSCGISREGDTFALNEPLPEYEFDQRVNW